MKRLACWQLVALAATLPAVAPAEPIPRSISPSRQFIIYGADPIVRGAVSDAAERVKTNLLTTLQRPSEWTVPIVLNLQPPQTNMPELPPAALTFSQTGAGLKIQLDLLLGRDFEPDRLEREVLRALLLEMSYRSQAQLPAGQPYVPPPEWLVEGLRLYHREAPEVLDALQAATARPPSLQRIVTQKWALLDPASQVLFRGYASALVIWLLDRENGPAAMSHYIFALPQASGDALADLRRYFPALGQNEAQVDENWRRALARIADERSFAILPFTESSRRLDEILRVNIAVPRAGKEPLNLEETIRAKKPEIDRGRATKVAEELLLLSTRAHPLVRPIAVEYQKMAALLARRKTRGLLRPLEKTTALRKLIAERMQEVDDYLNWFEATQAKTASGAFRGYFEAAKENKEIVRRRDPISVYLDAMENQYP